jgi:hypothetical protein
MRTYHVVAMNDATGNKEYLTCTPVTHDEGCTMMRKMTPHRNVRIYLEEAQIADPRPGFYYVSAIDGNRKALVSGPYETHQQALDKVREVRAAAEKVDPRSFWYAWGTALCEENAGPGVLGRI